MILRTVTFNDVHALQCVSSYWTQTYYVLLIGLWYWTSTSGVGLCLISPVIQLILMYAIRLFSRSRQGREMNPQMFESFPRSTVIFFLPTQLLYQFFNRVLQSGNITVQLSFRLGICQSLFIQYFHPLGFDTFDARFISTACGGEFIPCALQPSTQVISLGFVRSQTVQLLLCSVKFRLEVTCEHVQSFVGCLGVM